VEKLNTVLDIDLSCQLDLRQVAVTLLFLNASLSVEPER